MFVWRPACPVVAEITGQWKALLGTAISKSWSYQSHGDGGNKQTPRQESHKNIFIFFSRPSASRKWCATYRSSYLGHFNFKVLVRLSLFSNLNFAFGWISVSRFKRRRHSRQTSAKSAPTGGAIIRDPDARWYYSGIRSRDRDCVWQYYRDSCLLF